MKYLTNKKITWVCRLVFPFVRFYIFRISGINDNNSEVNKSWQIYFLLTQKEILKSAHSKNVSTSSRNASI